MPRALAVVLAAGLVSPAGLLGACAAEPAGGGMPSPSASPAADVGATAPPASTGPAPSTTAPSGPACPATALVEEVDWVQRSDGTTLRVRPSEDLRACGGPFVAAADPLPGWDDLVLRMPEADLPGMREQYACHLRLAPGKEVWHLEPWRPVVTEAQLLASLCNPGSPDPDLPTS